MIEEGFAVSVTEENIEMKKKILDCLINEEGEKSNEIFYGVGGLPDLLKGFSSVFFLKADGYLPYDKMINLFLLLNQLFGDTYVVDYSGEWIDDDESEDEDDWGEDEDEDEDEDDEWDDWDESGEVNRTKEVELFVPQGLKKCTFVLSMHEVLDMGGGSNGGDLDFVDESGIKEVQLDKKIPDDSFVEEMLGKANEKGYADLIALINEKVKNENENNK